MGVGAGLYMYVVVVQKFTFAISSPDKFLWKSGYDPELVGLSYIIYGFDKHCQIPA